MYYSRTIEIAKINGFGCWYWGFSKNQKEMVESKFDLFSDVEIETGVKKLIPQTFRPISTSSSQGPYLLFQLILISLQMLEVFVSMDECVSKRKILMAY